MPWIFTQYAAYFWQELRQLQEDQADLARFDNESPAKSGED